MCQSKWHRKGIVCTRKTLHSTVEARSYVLEKNARNNVLTEKNVQSEVTKKFDRLNCSWHLCKCEALLVACCSTRCWHSQAGGALVGPALSFSYFVVFQDYSGKYIWNRADVPWRNTMPTMPPERYMMVPLHLLQQGMVARLGHCLLKACSILPKALRPGVVKQISEQDYCNRVGSDGCECGIATTREGICWYQNKKLFHVRCAGEYCGEAAAEGSHCFRSRVPFAFSCLHGI